MSHQIINPHYFTAILDGIPHRFVLVLECEATQSYDGFNPPRFSVGALNATRDPRLSNTKQLMEVSVTNSALQIPPHWLMAHQYIYVIHENTDEFGWQYRSQWVSPTSTAKEETWSNHSLPNSQVRRRIWMTTIVPRLDLIRAKRLIAENIRQDNGSIKLQGDLLRYEKGTLTKSWQKRRVILFHNRLEFYSGNNKKGEVLLNDCEVKLLSEIQCPGHKYAFSIRNPTGSVGILLDAEDKDVRRNWVLAIQYQLALNSHEVNFAPLEYSPPTGEYPDNRVYIAGDLMMQGKNPNNWFPRNFQLLTREIVYYEDDKLRGRIFVEQASITSDERNLNFTINSASGIVINLSADSPEAKNLWLLGVRRQVQAIENQKLKQKTVPKEEQSENDLPVIDRIAQYYDSNWTAPAVEGEDEDYLLQIFLAQSQNNPDHYEFSEELGVYLDSKHRSASKGDLGPITPDNDRPLSTRSTDSNITQSRLIVTGNSSLPPISQTKSLDIDVSENRPTLQKIKSTKSFLNVLQPQVKLLDPKRHLINPRFMLGALKGITHRFVLILESENRVSASREINVLCPARFTVGGPRASKDPRTVGLNQLIPVTNKNPEILLPGGWLMLHQYIYIVQQNTDDDGWQYRSRWSDGNITATDEQWVDTCEDEKQVRRRLWMTTVVKRDDLFRAKKLVYEELGKSKSEFILQEYLFLYHPDQSHSLRWQKRKVILSHNKIEFYSGNDKKGEANLIDCEIKALTNEDENLGRDFSFCIKHPNGSVNIILDADTYEMRLRWMKAILYQLCIITPDVNFEPLPFGPPTGELPQSRVLYCGDLETLEMHANRWDTYQFQLQERALLCFSRDFIRGRLFIDQAMVKTRDDENEFTLKLVSGFVIHFRADSPETKYAWIRALKRQIQYLEYKRLVNKSNEETWKINFERSNDFRDVDWVSQDTELLSETDYLMKLQYNFESNFVQFWPGINFSSAPSPKPGLSNSTDLNKLFRAFDDGPVSPVNETTNSKFSDFHTETRTDVQTSSMSYSSGTNTPFLLNNGNDPNALVLAPDSNNLVSSTRSTTTVHETTSTKQINSETTTNTIKNTSVNTITGDAAAKLLLQMQLGSASPARKFSKILVENLKSNSQDESGASEFQNVQLRHIDADELRSFSMDSRDDESQSSSMKVPQVQLRHVDEDIKRRSSFRDSNGDELSDVESKPFVQLRHIESESAKIQRTVNQENTISPLQMVKLRKVNTPKAIVPTELSDDDFDFQDEEEEKEKDKDKEKQPEIILEAPNGAPINEIPPFNIKLRSVKDNNSNFEDSFEDETQPEVHSTEEYDYGPVANLEQLRELVQRRSSVKNALQKFETVSSQKDSRPGMLRAASTRQSKTES